jgi:hypothetical protein
MRGSAIALIMSPDHCCPICSSGIGQCDHELVRWSYVASEFEPCAFLVEVKALSEAVRTVLRGYVNRFQLPESPELWELCLTSCRGIEFAESGEWDLSCVDVTTYALDAIRKMPGVVLVEEAHLGSPETYVLWSADPNAVRQCICALACKLEIDASREWVPEWMADELQTLKDAALTALHGHMEEPLLKGPYRWGAAGSPRVNVYRGGWPPDEHLVYFLALPRKPLGLHSSTAVVLDYQDFSVLSVEDAGDEG